MVRFLKNLFLQQGGLDLVIVQYDVLPERLHRVDAARVPLLHQEHLSKTALSNHTLDNEILQLRGLLLWLPLEKCIGAHLGDFGILRLHLIEAAKFAAVAAIVAHIQVASLAARGQAWEGAAASRGRRSSRVLRVLVLVPHAELLVGVDLVAFADVPLGRVEILQSVGHGVDGQVHLVVLPADVLDRVEDVVSVLALEAVVVLALDVHHELRALALGALSDRLDGVDADSALN